MAENSSNGGFNIGDFAGLSEPLKKLIEVVSSGMGRVFQASFTRKDADAKAYEIRTIAAAKADAYLMLSESVRDASPGTGGVTITEDGATISSLPAHEDARLPNLPMVSLEQRTESRTSYQDAIRQQNIESVTAIAAEQLAMESEVSGDPVDSDWAARFFRYAEDFSNEQMQNIWGRVLAGEVKSPGAFSYRSLELIRNISAKEAQLFSTLASRVCSVTPTSFGYVTSVQNELTAVDRLLLAEAGLFGGLADDLTVTMEPLQNVGVEYQGYLMEITNQSGTAIGIDFIPITAAGRELLPLVDPSFDEGYIRGIGAYFASRGCGIKYGQVMTRGENGRARQYKIIPGWLNGDLP